MTERRWFEQPPPEPAANAARNESFAKDLWLRCKGCSEALYRADLPEQRQVCTHCGYHLRLDAMARIELLADEGTWLRVSDRLAPMDTLGFVDSKPYIDRISASYKKTGELDGFISGSCEISGVPVELGVMNFSYMGGSMGSVVGELITRLYERATERKRPAIVVSASGGARMQEGLLSLMQMAKTCAALARLKKEAKMPYISVLTDPTTGGVAASFAMLGDIIIAEPNALIGFAGPRVIEQTIGESLPEGFQTSEYLLDHGMIDQIVHRWEMKETLGRHLRWMMEG